MQFYIPTFKIVFYVTSVFPQTDINVSVWFAWGGSARPCVCVCVCGWNSDTHFSAFIFFFYLDANMKVILQTLVAYNTV